MIEYQFMRRDHDENVLIQAVKLSPDEMNEAFTECFNRFRKARPNVFSPTVRIKIHDEAYGDVLRDGYVMITG